MSLQRRLLLYLLVCAPLVWGLTLLVSVQRARHEVNELFDAEMIRLARQVQVVMHATPSGPAPTLPAPSDDTGEADMQDLAIAVWDAQGKLMLADREGSQLLRRPAAAGFTDDRLDGEDWRVYYLQSASGEWLVAAGQKVHERDELVYSLTASQIMPWVLVLPVLLAAMALAVRKALEPVRKLTDDLQNRDASDLHAVPQAQAPAELKPLVGAMNGLFTRIEETLARERRFTADAAHELRTPLAALRLQWDVVRRSHGEDERQLAEAKFRAGLDRMDRLVTQLLALSRVEASPAFAAAHGPAALAVHWPDIVEQAMNDCLPLAERRHIELACEWPPEGQRALPMHGDAQLLTVLLRNLLDNAVRYAPEGSLVTLRFTPEWLALDNEGEPLGAQSLARLGERFHRPDGQQEVGSGLGVSIVQRVAALHGLQVVFGPMPDGRGMRVVLRRAPEPASAPASAA